MSDDAFDEDIADPARRAMQSCPSDSEINLIPWMKWIERIAAQIATPDLAAVAFDDVRALLTQRNRPTRKLESHDGKLNLLQL